MAHNISFTAGLAQISTSVHEGTHISTEIGRRRYQGGRSRGPLERFSSAIDHHRRRPVYLFYDIYLDEALCQ